MKILGLSTATPTCTVAVVENDQVLAEGAYEDEKRHAERLFGLIDDVLSRASMTRDQIDALACDVGPGSFTGLRVGVASAKGIAQGLAVPLIGVCGLRAMAHAALHAHPTASCVAPVIDAKRGEVFFAVYGRDQQQIVAPTAVARSNFAETFRSMTDDIDASIRKSGSLLLCGRVLLDVPGLTEQVVVDGSCSIPDASWMARVAGEELKANPPAAGTDDATPIYAREPDAKPQGAPGHGVRKARPS